MYRSSTVESEISSLAIHSIPSIKYVAVATWTGDLLIYTFDDLKAGSPPISKTQLPSYAASLFFRTNTEIPSGTGVRLLAGLGTGLLVVQELEMVEASLVLTTRKSLTLGSLPLTLSPIHHQGKGGDNIVAVGMSSRASIISENQGRFEISSISRKVRVIGQRDWTLLTSRTYQQPLAQRSTERKALRSPHLPNCLSSRSTRSRSCLFKPSTQNSTQQPRSLESSTFRDSPTL